MKQNWDQKGFSYDFFNILDIVNTTIKKNNDDFGPELVPGLLSL